MAKTLSFDLSGYASIPIEEVNFFDSAGTIVDVSHYSHEDLLSLLQDGELQFDWLQVANNLSADTVFDVTLDNLDVAQDSEDTEEEEDEEF
jgi:hypothetical protein